MKKFFCVLMLCFVCATISAQTMKEVVYLKNGSIIKGDILELKPEESVKIKTGDGNIFVFPMTDVDKITKEAQEQPASNVRKDFDVEPKGFIYTVDGKMYYTEAMNLRKENISAQIGESQVMVPMSDIVLYEALDVDGIVYLQKDKIKKLEPMSYDGNLSTFVAQGKKVYIPVCYPSVAQHWASKRLRELLISDGYWKIVGCEEEADFIIKYRYEDKGSDHSYLMIFDGLGNEVAKSKNVSASYMWPTRVGDKTAEELYTKYIKKGLQRGKLNGWKTIAGMNLLQSFITDTVTQVIIRVMNNLGGIMEFNAIVDKNNGSICFRDASKPNSMKQYPIEDVTDIFVPIHSKADIPSLPCDGYIKDRWQEYPATIHSIDDEKVIFSSQGSKKMKDDKLKNIKRIRFFCKDIGAKLYYYYIP